MSMNDNERMANDARLNDRFNRGLARKVRKGDRYSAELLGEIQKGRLDLTGSFGIRNANQDRDLNIGQNRVDQKNQGVWADQGAGDIPEPGQAPVAAEPHRGNGQKSNGTPLQGANGARPTNPGAPAARAELANTPTLQQQQEAIDNGGMAPSATRPAATSPASRVFAGNGNAVPVNSDGSRKPSFQEIEDAARERSTKSGAFGKVDKDGELIKTDYAKVAQDAFKKDLGKSALLKTGLDYEAGKAPEEVKAAQQKALERGLSLGGKREELQAMIGMETDSAAIERKAGEVASKDKTDSASRIAKIEAGLKKTGDKAANDYLSENRDTFDTIDTSISKAKEIREGVDKDEASKELYSATDREALVINEAEQKDKLSLLKEKQAAGSRDKELGSLAADEIINARKEITDNLNTLHADTSNPLFSDAPSSAFSGRAYEGDWINDESQGIMPDKEFLRANAENPEAIKKQIRANISNRQNVDKAFNSELGGKDVSIKTQNGLGDYRGTEKNKGASDSLSSKKDVILGRKLNPGWAPKGKENADIFGEDNSGSGPVNAVRRSLQSTIGRGASSNEAYLPAPTNQHNLDKTTNQVIKAAEKSGYPIWQDKELMDNPAFKKKVMANPVLKQRAYLHEQSLKEVEKTREIVNKASLVAQKVKDQDEFFNSSPVLR